MFNFLRQDEKFVKAIYNFITPIMVIDEPRIENHQIKIYLLISNMRNTACHHLINGDYIRPLFVNLFKLYKVFGLKKYKKLNMLWNGINRRRYKLCKQGDKFIEDEEINTVVVEQPEFYNYFKRILHYFHGTDDDDIVIVAGLDKSDIKTLYKYVAPIILWYQNVEKQFNNENNEDIFFSICKYTRTVACHFIEYVKDETILRKIVTNMCIIYLAFGVDLHKYIVNIKRIVDRGDKMCYCYNLNDEIIPINGDDVIRDIRNVLIDKYNPWREKYFLFGKFLHFFESEIKIGRQLTNENNLKLNDDGTLLVDVETNKIDKKSIFKLASAIFVWIDVVNTLPNIDINNRFYIKMNKIKQKIINYIMSNQDDLIERNNILRQIKLIYDPIEISFTYNRPLYNRNLNKIQHYTLFKNLFERSVIGRKKQEFSLSFIFKYYFRVQKNNIIAKTCDILNFSGVFYIFVDLFDNDPAVVNDDFYKDVKETTELITNYMKQYVLFVEDRIAGLQNQVIDSMKSVFSDFRKINPSNYNDFHKIFAQLYFYIVTSMFK